MKRFLQPTEALVAASWLRSAGVPAELSDYYLCSLHWLIIPALGGFGLELDEEQLEVLRCAPPRREEPTAADLACYRRIGRRRRLIVWITLVAFYPWLFIPVLAVRSVLPRGPAADRQADL